jgi:hypothetical protein
MRYYQNVCVVKMYVADRLYIREQDSKLIT